MNKPKPANKVDNLLAAIQRKVTANPEAEHEQPSTAPVPLLREPTALRKEALVTGTGAVPRNRVGKPVQFWLHDEDRRLVRELSAWLAGQGERPTDSLVIRAALRTASSDIALLNAYRQASRLDGRLKQHKTSS